MQTEAIETAIEITQAPAAEAAQPHDDGVRHGVYARGRRYSFRIDSLPKGAREYIERLEGHNSYLQRQYAVLQAANDTLRGRHWFKLPGPKLSDGRKVMHLWLLDADQPFPVCDLSTEDMLIVGRHDPTGESLSWCEEPPIRQRGHRAWTLRPFLQWFAIEIEAKLRKNDHKPSWLRDPMRALFVRLLQEVEELNQAIYAFEAGGTVSPADIVQEAADVAAFAGFIAEKAKQEAGEWVWSHVETPVEGGD